MKRKPIQILPYCLIMSLAVFLTMIVACSPEMTSMSTTTATDTIALFSISVAPAEPAVLVADSTQQFTATGTFSNGAKGDITSQVIWASSDTAVATISASGLATGVISGDVSATTNIAATWEGVTSSVVVLTVDSP
jgi:NADH:ubiquinone oxidoreductase subunit K